MEKKQLTTTAGIPVGDNQNSLTVGPHGPLLMQDFQLLEKMAHFNRERLPERVVHAKGAGAYGTFTVTGDITQYSKAKVFESIGKETEVFTRFSTVGGEKGSADSVRDPRGFAVKFYTEEGNWDLVGNNTPVFFIRDPMKFPDFIHTQKRCPVTNLKPPTAMWDFWSLSPESLHQVTILFSDRGTPKGYRHMSGYGSHTFSLIDHNDERVWCKFHLKTNQGIKCNSEVDAIALAGVDPEQATRDLYASIEVGDSPSWTVHIQVMTDEQARAASFNPFDLTKVWPHADYPLIEVGMLELNRNPQNYHVEVEQSAFAPGNVVPGIGLSPDKMLQARIMAYPDAHRYRLGVNYESLPSNRPRCPVHNYHADGAMRFEIPENGGTPNYEPNSFGGPVQDAQYIEPPVPVDGPGYRFNHREGNEDYLQAGALFRLMTEEEQQRLISNIVGAMGGVSRQVQTRQVYHFFQADPAYGEGVAKGLGIDVSEIQIGELSAK